MKYLKFTKNKQLLAIVLSVLLVSACSDITQNELLMLSSACEGQGGFYKATVHPLLAGKIEVTCKDGGRAGTN